MPLNNFHQLSRAVISRPPNRLTQFDNSCHCQTQKQERAGEVTRVEPGRLQENELINAKAAHFSPPSLETGGAPSEWPIGIQLASSRHHPHSAGGSIPAVGGQSDWRENTPSSMQMVNCSTTLSCLRVLIDYQHLAGRDERLPRFNMAVLYPLYLSTPSTCRIMA